MTDPLARLWAALADRYTVEAELGRGGMALVFRARDLRHDRLVALKVVRPELASVVGRERFLREIQVAARLQHPNIVPVHDSGGTDDTLYYVMPYVAGESLRTRLGREGPLPIEDALEISRDVANALSYAHDQGIVHRDVKPENILLSGSRALVADFGIARAFGGDAETRLTATGLVVGTPAYMSPEQAAGRQDVDARSDVYALGCVLYEMLTGEAPYTGPSAQAIIAKRVIEPIPHVRTLRDAVPPGLEQAVTRALAKTPVDRFQSAAEFAAALTPKSISRASASVRATVPTPAAAPAVRGRRRWTLAVLGGVILAGVVGALALRRSPTASAGTAAIAPDARRVVVAVFANKTGDPSLDPLGDITADYLARGLADTRLVEVIDARAEQAGDPAARARGVAGARALARSLGAGSVVWGSYYRVGDSLQFQAQLTDAATGELLGAPTPASGSARQQTQGVEVLRQRVMTTLAARLDPEFSRFEESSRPASYDAYREYLTARDLEFTCPPTRDCPAEIDAHFWRAYALDSTFTLPLIDLAANNWLSNQCARTDSIARALEPRRDGLPAADRARLDMATHMCHGKPLLAQEAIREGIAAAPRSDALVLRYAWLARHNGFLRETVAATEKLDRKRNERELLYWGNLIIPYHLLGEHERELEAARAARAAFPGDLEQVSFEARALVGLGRLDEVNAVVDELFRVPEEAPQGMSGKGPYIHFIGQDLRAHGHVAEAQQVFERGIRWYRSLPPNARAADGPRDAYALLLYGLGRWKEALPIIRQLAAKSPDEPVMQAWVGAVHARLGDRQVVDSVDRWLAEHKREYRDFTSSATYERARLAAILGERDRAVALLRQAAEEGAFLDGGQGFGPHSDLDFESLREYPPFQELMKPKS